VKTLATLLLLPLFVHWYGPQPINGPSKAWWEGLTSKKGLCCSFADGVAIKDVDWGTEPVDAYIAFDVTSPDGTVPTQVYWVQVMGMKLPVPPDAVVVVPNRFGGAVVWPYQDATGAWKVRCFMPGTES
jgi:hypothetical protein